MFYHCINICINSHMPAWALLFRYWHIYCISVATYTWLYVRRLSERGKYWKKNIFGWKRNTFFCSYIYDCDCVTLLAALVCELQVQKLVICKKTHYTKLLSPNHTKFSWEYIDYYMRLTVLCICNRSIVFTATFLVFLGSLILLAHFIIYVLDWHMTTSFFFHTWHQGAAVHLCTLFCHVSMFLH